MRSWIFGCSLLILTMPVGQAVEFDDGDLEILEKKVNPCGETNGLTLRDAIAYTLQNQPNVKIAIEDVARQRGVVQELAGPFDAETSLLFENTDIANSQSPDFFTKMSGKITQLSVNESKQFRNGSVVSIGAGINQVKDPGRYIIPYNEGTLNVSLTQPLLRGFLYGPDITAERASKVGYKATYYESLHKISEQLLTTIINYWNVVEAQKTVKIRLETVEAFQNLYRKTMRLVEEDQIARSELNQPLANLSVAKVNYTVSLQQLYVRKQLLKLSLGNIPIHCISSDLFEATEDFPEVTSNDDMCDYMNDLVSISFRNRNDLVAFKFRELEFKYLLQGASNDLLPELDLIAEYQVANYKRGEPSRKFFSGYDIGTPDRRGTVGVSFSMPFCNNEAKGRYRRISADLIRTELQTVDLKQNIISDVMSTLSNHYHIISEIQDAKKAVKRFHELVLAEGKRLKEGIGSLFNLIDYENNLTSSKETLARLQRDYAENLARLHFNTGSLLLPDANLCVLDVGDIRQPPLVKDCD